MAEVSSQTLHIVARELASELNEARASLEAFGEQQDNLALLRKCNEHLHSVHGALRVAEVYGAALLSEEMGQVAHYLIGNFNEKRHLAEGLDALMRAMVQLPTYLERVMSGGRDMALVLLPLLNDLRAVRGHALLSEGTLLLLNLSSDQQANPAAAPGESALTVAQWSRKLRTRFQLGLLGWIKGERVDQNLEILSRTAEKLEHVATTQGVFQLWWVVGAVLEALREGGLESSASIKRLLGQADRDMKRLYELGEARYSDSPPLELLNNLLYYVARARTNGPRVAAVRASFRLSELLPVDDGVEQARESLSAPSVKLMKTVAAAIKEDLSRVKDALDIFVRQGGTQVDELAPQLELLKKIADTLGVLGLGELRDKVQSETTDLQAIVAQKSKASEATLLRMAATLIKVEDSLDEQLVGMIVPTQTEAGAAPSKPAGPDEIEFRLVTEAVLRECIVNMARIKEAIAHSVEKPRETPAVEQIPQLMRGITAGLLMLGKTRVVEIMEGIDRALAQFVRSDGLTLPQEAVDRLADAIVAVEYYMETIQAGRTDPWYMLDNAETCLRFLAEAQPIPRMEAFGGMTSDHARTVVIEPTAQTVALNTEHEPTAILDPVTNEVRRPTRPAAPAQPPALAKPADREVDPEFVELFIEEAKDEIAKLNQFFPMWDANPQDAEALVNVRRSFHTLKGSGRMVGAQLIGDFAWSVENMLNRVINKTLDRTPDIMSLMRSAVGAVPELVEQLETGRAPQVDIARIINTANTLAGVRPGPATPPVAATTPVRRAPEPPVLTAALPEKKTAQPVVTPPRAPVVPMDPGLHEIYAKETAGHLAAIRKFISACEFATPPYPVTDDLHRSCHTLSGTAKTAGARQGIKIAEPLNRYIRKLYDNSIGLPEAGLSVLKESVNAIQQVMEHLTENTGFFVDHDRIVKRLVDLEHELDQDISRLAEMLSNTTANSLTATAGDTTGEHLIPPTAASSVNELLSVAAQPVPGAIEIDEISLTDTGVLEPEAIELSPVEPSVLAAGLLEPAAPGEIPLDTAAVPEEITLGSFLDTEEITLGSSDAAPEEITLDSSGDAPEEITLDSSGEPEEITLGGEAEGEVIELDSSDAGALETLAWSYENFPPQRAAAAANDDASAEERELTAGEDVTTEAVVLEGSGDLGEELPDDVDIVVDDVSEIDVPSRALLQMNEPLPEDASDIVIETAAWAAEYEPPVLPVDTAPAVNRDEAETIRSPLLRPAEAELEASPIDATRAVEVAPTLLDESFEIPPAAEVPEAAPAAVEVEPFAVVSTIAPVPPEVVPPAPPSAAPPPALPIAAQAAAPPIEEEYDDSDFDADVAAIFTEEAAELLETADHSLSSWIRDRANSALVFELKRVVHTLKGGARMAGIRAMGDLTHELETLMGLVEAGQVPAEQQVFEVLQASLDELHRMRDLVANGERCKSARGLMNRIRALCGEEVEAAPEPAVAAPVAATPAAIPAAPIAPEVVPPAAFTPPPEPIPEPVFDAPPEEVVEIVDYSPDDKDIGSQTDIVPMLTDFEVPEVLDEAPEVEALSEVEVEVESVDARPEVEELSDVEAEFGADELGAVAPREAVRFEEPPTPAVNAEHMATGAHAALDVATLPPELPPDSEQEEVVVEPQTQALPGRERQAQQERQEFARVDADLLDNLLNNAGEVSIFRSRMEQQVSSIEFNLAELGRTVTRLKDQLRKLEMETEAQILHRHQEEHPDRADFDPLELDRYSTIQQLTRAFAESVSDVSSIEGLLENLTREAQNLLLQQSRVVTEMQNGLMRTRMVPFQRHVQRLSRLVRQVASDTGKRADLVVVGASGELDRQVLDRMLPPFEHMLRNSVVHGIETPEERAAAGKSPQGTIKVGLHREGSEMVIVLEDDGRGIDVNAVRERAKSRGLLQAGRVLTDEEAMQLILEPGFSTASNITQHAGRGVGMDVVVNEIKKLGGALFTQSQPGQGVKFTIRLPFTLAITQALIVRTGDELYALPLPSVEGVARVSKSEVQKHLAEDVPTFNYGGQVYRLQHLGAFVGGGPSALPELDVSVPLILIRAGDHSTAIVTDELVGSREMVVKSVGPQIATIRGIAGATILGDGRIVIILDMGALVRSDWRGGKAPLESQGPKLDKRTFALVVDDSITVRRVTQRLLERNGMRVMTAKDGIDALSILQEHIPDVILLDIEMPRMDGYELATQVRADARLTDIPIVMITSRVGEKHRARAIEIGVNDYLGKPYQENQLLDAIEPLVQARRRKVS